jgi:hypothetical protein
MTLQPGFRFYALHMTTRFDPTDPEAFTIEALLERCLTTKRGAKYVWTRVLKQARRGFHRSARGRARRNGAHPRDLLRPATRR